MPSYVITGASRGIGVSHALSFLRCFFTFFCFLSQLEFVRQLSADKRNTVIAVVRNEKTADQLLAIRTENIHILEADIVDHVALDVSPLL